MSQKLFLMCSFRSDRKGVDYMTLNKSIKYTSSSSFNVQTILSFLAVLKLAELPSLGIEHTPQQWPKTQHWQSRILNPLGHQGTSVQTNLNTETRKHCLSWIFSEGIEYISNVSIITLKRIKVSYGCFLGPSRCKKHNNLIEKDKDFHKADHYNFPQCTIMPSN